VLLGVVTGSGDLARLAGQFGQLNVLSYSRGQEFEADNLGIRYLQQLGYEPGALADMLQALQREDELEARIRGREEAKGTPAWARTHPLTSDRIARAVDQARRNGPACSPNRKRRS
jgi:predicted Zn-dependent protease